MVSFKNFLISAIVGFSILLLAVIIIYVHPNLSLPTPNYYHINQALYTEKYHEALFICTSSGCSLYYFTMIPIQGICSFNTTVESGFNQTLFLEACNLYHWLGFVVSDVAVGSQVYSEAV